MSNARKYADALERVVWTLVEAAGAGGLVAGYQSLPAADISDGWVPAVVLVLTVVISAVKNVVATNTGVKGTGSTLPKDLQPIAPDVTQDELPEGVGMSYAERHPDAEDDDPSAN